MGSIIMEFDQINKIVILFIIITVLYICLEFKQ